MSRDGRKHNMVGTAHPLIPTTSYGVLGLLLGSAGPSCLPMERSPNGSSQDQCGFVDSQTSWEGLARRKRFSVGITTEGRTVYTAQVLYLKALCRMSLPQHHLLLNHRGLSLLRLDGPQSCAPAPSLLQQISLIQNSSWL